MAVFQMHLTTTAHIARLVGMPPLPPSMCMCVCPRSVRLQVRAGGGEDPLPLRGQEVPQVHELREQASQAIEALAACHVSHFRRPQAPATSYRIYTSQCLTHTQGDREGGTERKGGREDGGESSPPTPGVWWLLTIPSTFCAS